ncbi:DUF5994 family protein [uncultured Gordonia sp.]|uniref:DUF5994 family protein n=1 Tax=uncultured Gordonia sp. TaxID=198437 RepID=UPI002590D33F|nr:DUF5994 family protein [uncultured Gordonia sp.]
MNPTPGRPSVTLGPTRVRLCSDPKASVAGAWYPYTVQIADELSRLSTAVAPVLGEITAIEVNWQSFRRYPGLDSADAPAVPPLMTLTTPTTTATLLVIPSRTGSALAALLLRLAGQTEITDGRIHSLDARRAQQILARAGQYLATA